MKNKDNRRTKPVNRSKAGTVVSFLCVLVLGIFMAIPFVYAVNNAFKPLNELFVFPPKLFVQNPTLDNFRDLFSMMADGDVPFSRYFFNTFLVTAVGTVIHIFVASYAAFLLAKFQFPGRKLIFEIVVLSLMFVPQVTAIPNYMTMADLHMIDTPFSLIVPAIGGALGLFLMKQFIETMVPDAVLEAARIDGAGIFRTFWSIVMHLVKPAWLTLAIFSIQNLWNINSGTTILSEEWKTLSFALSQIVAGGIARAGVSSAVAVIIMIVPVVSFILTQSNVVETMSSSGMKD